MTRTITWQVDYCKYCNAMTKVLMDENGVRYCGKCGYRKDKN